jgi:hypothetical protein
MNPFEEYDRDLLWLAFLLSLLMCWPAPVNSQALPNPTLTPGAVNVHVIAKPGAGAYLIDGVEYNLCAKDFRTKPFRKTSDALKKAICSEYGAKDCPNAKRGEIDHLIPLELGGADVLANLWWQPAPAYRVKDRQVEDKLPRLVCAGKLSLADAQACIRDNWVTCAAKVRELER